MSLEVTATMEKVDINIKNNNIGMGLALPLNRGNEINSVRDVKEEWTQKSVIIVVLPGHDSHVPIPFGNEDYQYASSKSKN